MMDCFILKSGNQCADAERTMLSLQPVVNNFKVVNHLNQINYEDKLSEWYGVFYDNEFIGAKLCEGLTVFFDFAEVDCLVLCKSINEHSMSKSPKIFRSDIKLRDNQLLPEEEYSFLTVLDGYVWNHDQNPV